MNDAGRQDIQDELDIAAGEYVLGTLSGTARRQFEILMEGSSLVKGRVAEWEDRLAPFASALPPIPPPHTVWKAIDRAARLGKAPRVATPPAPRVSIWYSLGFWRFTTLVAGGLAAVALALSSVLLDRPPPAPPANPGRSFAVLVDDQRQATWLVRADAEKHRLAINPVRPLLEPPGRSYELWLVVPGEQPRSLGLLPAVGRVIDDLPEAFEEGTLLAVSLEEMGGSTSGTPAGPVLHMGAIVDTGDEPVGLPKARTKIGKEQE